MNRFRYLYWIENHLTGYDKPMPQQLINLITSHLSIRAGPRLTDDDNTAPRPPVRCALEPAEHCVHPHHAHTAVQSSAQSWRKIAARAWSFLWTWLLWQ